MHILLKVRINAHTLIPVFNNVLTLIHFVQGFCSRKKHASDMKKLIKILEMRLNSQYRNNFHIITISIKHNLECKYY